VLRLLGSGPNGAILLALGNGPLRTKRLTQRVSGYAPRTVYRHAGVLAGVGLLERREEPGVPSKVTHNLSRPSGRDLFRLLDASAIAALPRLPDGQADARAWASFELLAELWESGIVDELSCEARSPTELATAPHGLSFHQIDRRAHLFTASGLLSERPGRGRNKRYGLTEKTRRDMALIAGIGRWRRRYVTPESPGLTVAEMATVLRTALPLVRLPQRVGKSISLTVIATDGRGDEEGETLWARAERRGAVRCGRGPAASADGWARATVGTWLVALLDGKRGRLQVGGDVGLIDAYLTQLYARLWRKGPPG